MSRSWKERAWSTTLRDGSPFPFRDLIIFLTFYLICVTLVVQGLTLAPLIRKLKVGTDWTVMEEQRHARLALTRAAMAAIDETADREGIARQVAERIRAELAERIRLEVPRSEVLHAAEPAKGPRRAAIEAERRELIRIWRDQQISDAVLHLLEQDLDFPESRL